MESEDDNRLPPGVETAWGLRKRPAKGPKPALTLPRIVQAAVGVAADEGITAVSMSRVAAELGASTMSLYRYVSSKDELLTLMQDSAIGHPPPMPPGVGWREGLAHWAWSMIRVLRLNPWLLRVPVAGPPATPNNVAWMEQALRCLTGTSIAEPDKVSVVLLVTIYIRGQATLNADLEVAWQGKQDDTYEGALNGYSALLRKVTDRRDFPALHAVIDSGAFEATDSADEDFIWGLDRLLDGVERLLRDDQE
ncbi:TetR/AcrR family transcriptional regulator [Spongiactinospora sp. TRM90649]|uniref:TetR/AcrR family transcriptional regulator n=1 Tax=Spongiactinospora sp. TRM90649 TaxID=3031114 RepID=UPI0023F92909|nr:TetR/AcrR family transcriptional regulator [Spongiactinospora sp. TRM90649]MDF5752883.1 TetR/AcrR family transcriptional regulator [Spongiactinospora sp. TRM90649]